MTSSNKESLGNPLKILQAIDQWQKKDLRELSNQKTEKLISDFLDEIFRYTTTTKSTSYLSKSLWRVRAFKCLCEIEKEDGLWAPPAEITKLGRCNIENKPVLYVSENAKTPFEELTIPHNEEVCLIEYTVRSCLHLSEVVPELEEGNKLNLDEPSIISRAIFREFIRSEFTKPVGKGTEYLYRISASMCNIIFEGTEGWRYPSVPRPSDYNIAIKPDVAREKLKIKNVFIVSLGKTEHDFSDRVIETYLPSIENQKAPIIIVKKGQLNSNLVTWEAQKKLSFLGLRGVLVNKNRTEY